MRLQESHFARVIVDSNVLISAALVPASVPARLVDLLLKHSRLLFTAHAFDELASRLWKPKFDRYIDFEDRSSLLQDLRNVADWIELPAALASQRFSRDVDDDAFVQLALAAECTRLISGDNDLLEMVWPVGLKILTPRDALTELERLLG